MNDSERAISEYLDSLRIGGVQYEPDGNVPPDFLVDGRIAVEARRLNEHEEVNGGYRGLEVTATPLRAAVVKALDNSGPPVDSRSWFVHYTVRRPLPPWKEVERSLRSAVLEFRERSGNPPREMRLGRSIRLRFHPTSQTHPTLLLLGSSSDHDAGGFLVAELARNLQICIPEKVQKIASFRQRYSEWWLAFEDRISYGKLDSDDVSQLRQALGPVAGFAKVILVNPLQPTKGIEIWPSIAASRWAKQKAAGGSKRVKMNQCFFCGPTENKITEEHVWPRWVSELLRGKYGSDHFIHVRSTGSDTTGLWKSPNLKVTTETVCDRCNNNWLSAFENDDIRPLATPLILGERVDIIKPDNQWKLAAWAYKMALLLEVAIPPEERSPEFYTADERLQFHQTTLSNEHIRVFLANYKYGQHPAHAHQHLHTLIRREDGVKFHLRITTITAGCLGMQVIAIRGLDSGELMYAKTEMEFEMLGKAKVAIAPIWPPTNEAVRWSSLEIMTTEDVENWTEMWSKAENVFPVPKDPGDVAPPSTAS